MLIEGHGHEPSGPDEVPCALDTLSLRRARRRGGPCRAFSTSTVLAPGTSVKRQRVGPCCLADRAVPAPLLKNGEPPRARKTMGNWAWGGGAGGSCGVCHQAGVQAPPARGMADWPGQDRGRDSLPDHRGFACCCSAEKYPTHRGARSTAVLHPLHCCGVCVLSWVTLRRYSVS